jgi:hypothetical protein
MRYPFGYRIFSSYIHAKLVKVKAGMRSPGKRSKLRCKTQSTNLKCMWFQSTT